MPRLSRVRYSGSRCRFLRRYSAVRSTTSSRSVCPGSGPCSPRCQDSRIFCATRSITRCLRFPRSVSDACAAGTGSASTRACSACRACSSFSRFLRSLHSRSCLSSSATSSFRASPRAAPALPFLPGPWRLLAGKHFVFRRHPQDSGSNQLAELFEHGPGLMARKQIRLLRLSVRFRLGIVGRIVLRWQVVCATPYKS